MDLKRRDFLVKFPLVLAGLYFSIDRLLASEGKTLEELSEHPEQTPVYLPLNGKRTLEETIVIGTGILDNGLISKIAEEARYEHSALREKLPLPEKGKKGKIIYSQTEIPENFMHSQVVLNSENLEVLEWPSLQLETELNIPAFQWRIYQRYNDERILLADFPVIVGKRSTKTIIGDFGIYEIKHFPSWSLEGKHAAPGSPNNPLGEWEFRYVKDRMMYYHGTHEEHLFKESFRALSHGCVRNYNWNVSKLAALVLRNLNRLDEYDNKIHKTRIVPVNSEIPARNIYDTIEVFPDGKVCFYPNVYRYSEETDSVRLTNWEHFKKDIEEAGFSVADFDEARLIQEVKKAKNITQRMEINLNDYIMK